MARYRQIVGVAPRRLAPARPIERGLPRTVDEAQRLGLTSNPTVVAALHNVDAADIGVQVAEAELYPSLGLSASVAQRYDFQTQGDNRMTASVVGRLTVRSTRAGRSTRARGRRRNSQGSVVSRPTSLANRFAPRP